MEYKQTTALSGPGCAQSIDNAARRGQAGLIYACHASALIPAGVDEANLSTTNKKASLSSIKSMIRKHLRRNEAAGDLPMQGTTRRCLVILVTQF